MTGLVGKLIDVNCGDLVEFKTKEESCVAGYLTQFSTNSFTLSQESPYNHEKKLGRTILFKPLLGNMHYFLHDFEKYTVLKKRE